MRNQKHTWIISLTAAAIAVALVAGVLYFCSQRKGAVAPPKSTSAANAHAASNPINRGVAFSARSSSKYAKARSHLSPHTAGKISAIPATIPQSALAKVKLPRGIAFAQIPWLNDPANPLPEYVALAQPWYEPALEQRRHRWQMANGGTPKDLKSIEVLTNFSNSVPISTEEISPTHYALTFTGSQIRMYGGKCLFWFLFKVRGVRGKTIRFDLTNVNIKFWQTLNPVYSYCRRISGLRAMESAPPSDPRTTQAFNGAVLPNTGGQRWHFIANTWRSGNELCFVQKFKHDKAYIAMRYPYTPAYNEDFLASLKGNRYCRVVTIGKSLHGRPLQVVEIPRPVAGKQGRPGILVYARENGDEIDGSWPAQGAIQFLVSDSPTAQRLRENFQFQIIPILDPDGAALCIHHNAAQSFTGPPTMESSEYADYFQKWIDSGHRIDLAINLHCLESNDGPDVSCPAVTSGPLYAPVAMRVVRAIDGALAVRGYSVHSRPWFRGTIANRLVYWLQACYGTVMAAFEINGQGAERHLTLQQLRRIGGVMVSRAAVFLTRGAGRNWDAHIRRVLKQRAKDWKEYGIRWGRKSALLSEQAVQWRVHDTRLDGLIAREGLRNVARGLATGWSSPVDPW